MLPGDNTIYSISVMRNYGRPVTFWLEK